MRTQRFVTARAGDTKGREPGPWEDTDTMVELPGRGWDHRGNTGTVRDATRLRGVEIPHLLPFPCPLASC